MQAGRLIATLRVLRESKIDFILVGGLAAVLNGAPLQTYDVDIVYSRESANIERILATLKLLDAVFRIQPERRLRPAASPLVGRGHLNLLTAYGPLDLLATIGQNLEYQDLLPCSTELEIDEGVCIRVLNLDVLISIKEQVSGEKDTAVLPLLRQTLKERNKKLGFRPACE